MHYDPGLEISEDGWLKLDRNENLFIEAEWLQEAKANAASSLNLHLYPDPYSTRLRNKLAEIYNIDPNQIYVGNGADEILAVLLHDLRSQFDEVVTLPVTYKIYSLLFQRYGYKQLTLENASLQRPCLVDSPNSLSGETCSIFDIPTAMLIWDNVYGEFANDLLPLNRLNSKTVIIRSFSKFYGLANLRIGYCFSNEEIIQRLMGRKDIYNVNGFAQEMALQALNHKPYFDALIPLITRARHKLQEGLEHLGFIVSRSQSNCVWTRHPSISAEMIQTHLKKHRVAVRRFLEPNLCEWLRIAVPPASQIESLFSILKLAF